MRKLESLLKNPFFNPLQMGSGQKCAVHGGTGIVFDSFILLHKVPVTVPLKFAF
jgi:hypothetical protein